MQHLVALTILLGGMAFANNLEGYAQGLSKALEEALRTITTELAVNVAKGAGKALITGQNPSAEEIEPQTLRELRSGFGTLKAISALMNQGLSGSNLQNIEAHVGQVGQFLGQCYNTPNAPGCSLSSTERQAPPPTTAVLSFIEGLPGSLNRADEPALRRLPSVQFVHLERYRECRRRGFPQDCQYEHRVPMLLEQNALEVERGLSQAWNHFDRLHYWRTFVTVHAPVSTPLCATGIFDLETYNGNPSLVHVQGGEFCDDFDYLRYALPVMQFPYLCGMPSEYWLDWGELWHRYGAAYQHSLDRYYLDYWRKASALVMTKLPTALLWDGIYPTAVPGTSSGLVIQPVARLIPNPEQYLEAARKSLEVDLVRGAAYWAQAIPEASRLADPLLRRVPILDDARSQSVFKTLEQFKTDMATREGIFERPYQWYLPLGEAQPKGLSATATPVEYGVFGHAALFTLQSSWALENSPRGPVPGMGVPYFAWCTSLTTTPPFARLDPRYIPLPLPHYLPRVNTAWVSVPEGAYVQNTKGQPRSLLSILGIQP